MGDSGSHVAHSAMAACENFEIADPDPETEASVLYEFLQNVHVVVALFVALFVEASRKARSADGIAIAFEFVSDRDAEIALGRLGGNESWRNSSLSGGIQKLLTTLRESRL